jgi:hypothetical protein
MRVKKTDSENHNENFKTGRISIIVTTNKVRQEVNDLKLKRLLQFEKEFISDAYDQCSNLENPPEVPANMAITQTGGLEKKLKLKVGAPIVITSNHQTAKYKEDGIVNGARGYIDSLQTTKDNPENIEVVWVVFKDKNVGRLLRYDYRGLKKKHRPNDDNAVPIIKQKKSFTIQNGEVRFQRFQFPLTLAYAITAYKCQGDTLEEVIIDFGAAEGERTNIQWGSFYVALTQVKEGKHVFLASFEKSYITFNSKVEEKIDVMRKQRPYTFKKIYLHDQIFKSLEEVKLGYFNIRGFMESNHAEYLDCDRNLLHLDFLVLAETWLSSNISNSAVINKLKNWKIIKRLDSTDDRKHMGLILMCPITLSSTHLIYSLDYMEGYKSCKKEKGLLYQGLVMYLRNYYKKIVFVYVRETPNEQETSEMSKRFENFDVIIGDLNLNPSKETEKGRISNMCNKTKYMALQEVTTSIGYQLDHILISLSLKQYCFATSYFNFGSDHKPICFRMTSNENDFN